MFAHRLSIASFAPLLFLGPGAPVEAQGAPNTAQVCAETANVLRQLEREENEAFLPYWAMKDNYHDSFFAIVVLRDAAKEGKVSDEFDETARLFGIDPDKMSTAQKLAMQPEIRRRVAKLAEQVRTQTGRPRTADIDPDAGDPISSIFGALKTNDEDEDETSSVPVDPAVLRREADIEATYLRAQYQAQLRRQRLVDLNCNSLPTGATSADNGTLQRHTTKLQEDHGAPDQRYTYGENWADLLIVGDPPDRRQIRWQWQGVPGSLSPGDEFTIKITGILDFKPPGAERGANNSAGVRAEGLTAIKEENAYFYQGASREGTYTYKVPLNATRVVLELGADNNQAIFVRHCYGACAP